MKEGETWVIIRIEIEDRLSAVLTGVVYFNVPERGDAMREGGVDIIRVTGAAIVIHGDSTCDVHRDDAGEPRIDIGLNFIE